MEAKRAINKESEHGQRLVTQTFAPQQALHLEGRGLSPSDSKEFNDITAWELQHKTRRATNETYNIKPPSCHFYSNSKTLYWIYELHNDYEECNLN